jgi:hypothetical protein
VLPETMPERRSEAALEWWSEGGATHGPQRVGQGPIQGAAPGRAAGAEAAGYVAAPELAWAMRFTPRLTKRRGV